MNTDQTPAPPPQTRREYAKSLEKSMGCNCDLDNWEPEQSTGHSHVCRIHKAALQWIKPATPEPKPPQTPEPPEITDTDRAIAFEWVRELGLQGDDRKVRLAYIVMQTMTLAESCVRKRVSDQKTMEWMAEQWRNTEKKLDAAIVFIKELNATKNQHGRQYRSRCGQFLASLNASTIVPATEQARACGWVQDDEGWIFEASCGNCFSYDEEPDTSIHPFCPGCGRRVEVRTNNEQEETEL